MRRDLAVRAVVALGLTQIIGWGTTIYALGVLATPIVSDTGWSRALVFGGLSLGLVVSAVVSTFVGRAIDRYGARVVMSLGTALVVLGLFWISQAKTPAGYLAAWALLGPGMRMTLYDAAFAALVQVTPERGRQAISYLTLFGGFASTIFWPIGHELVVQFGWRQTLLVYAATNLALCQPLLWWGLARRGAGRRERADDKVKGGAATAATSRPECQEAAAQAPVPVVAQGKKALAGNSPGRLNGREKAVAIALFAFASSGSGFIIGAVAVHLVDLIAASGIAVSTAVFIASLKGIAQVAGRVWDVIFATRMRPMTLARVAIGFLPLSFGILLLGGASLTAAVVFTLALGVGNGLVTIMRGAFPLQLFGAQGYGTVLGIIATPVLLTNAVAPTILAFVIDLWGYGAGAWLLVGIGLLAYLAMETLALWLRR